MTTLLLIDTDARIVPARPEREPARRDPSGDIARRVPSSDGTDEPANETKRDDGFWGPRGRDSVTPMF